eukprot:3370336-Amphidinium_carterae.3
MDVVPLTCCAQSVACFCPEQGARRGYNNPTRQHVPPETEAEEPTHTTATMGIDIVNSSNAFFPTVFKDTVWLTF